MIVLDTNMIAELWKASPAAQVLAWMDAQAIETLHLSAITVAELRFGLRVMPDSKRRTIFLERLEHALLPLFAGRIVPFDLDASRAYAELMVRARKAGKTIGLSDGRIAASAMARSLIVATRDVAPFETAGLAVINPWNEPHSPGQP